jgi:hypothetical protein
MNMDPIGPLSHECEFHFLKHGFVRAPKDFLSAEEKKLFITSTDAMQDWPEKKGEYMKYYESKDGNKLLCRIENYIDYCEPKLKEIINGRMNDACKQLMAEDTIMFKEKVNFKLAGAQGFLPHQDAPAWTTFKQTLFVTAMVAIDKANVMNGCLEVVRNRHFTGPLPHPGGTIEPDLVKAMTWEPVECEPGDVVFFGAYIPHRSGPNVTNASRRVHYITYAVTREGDHRDGYYADKRIHFPPEIEREAGKDYSTGGAVYNLGPPVTLSSGTSD